VVTDPTTGQPVCASVLDGTDTACVPYDVFHKGGITQAAVNYLNTPSFSADHGPERDGIQVDSDLGEAYGWRTPWAKNGAAIALGYERRIEKLDVRLRFACRRVETCRARGGASPAVDGKYTVNEFYAEGRLPIMERQHWAYLLNLTGSYRHSDYDQPSNKTNTYGLGLEWAPVKEYKARGTYQRAIRAPNIIELYTPAGSTCSTWFRIPAARSRPGTPRPRWSNACAPVFAAARYNTTGLINSAGQYQFQQGGNPNLLPETAKTYTLGLVGQPMPNLSFTIDYWSIKLADAIGVVPQPLILQNCLLSGVFCDQIHRDSAGSLWRSDDRLHRRHHHQHGDAGHERHRRHAQSGTSRSRTGAA
jgi:hypothetical protein